MAKYCLDTSLFINGWNRYYCIEVFPSLWSELDRLLKEGIAYSCEEVLREIRKQQDGLTEWVKSRKSRFHTPDEKVIVAMRKIMKSHSNIAAAGSLNAADPWVIAHAQVQRGTVVTFEQSANTKATKPPKIPNVCRDLGIPCLNPVEFFTEVGISF